MKEQRKVKLINALLIMMLVFAGLCVLIVLSTRQDIDVVYADDIASEYETSNTYENTSRSNSTYNSNDILTDGTLIYEFRYRYGVREVAVTGYQGDISDADIIIPETFEGEFVREIGDEVFANSDIFSLTVESETIRIGERAFENCTNFRFFDANELSSVGEGAFRWCTNLEITVNCIRNINPEAFVGVKISDLYITSGRIIRTAFLDCVLGNVLIEQEYLSNAFDSCEIESLSIINCTYEELGSLIDCTIDFLEIIDCSFFEMNPDQGFELGFTQFAYLLNCDVPVHFRIAYNYELIIENFDTLYLYFTFDTVIDQLSLNNCGDVYVYGEQISYYKPDISKIEISNCNDVFFNMDCLPGDKIDQLDFNNNNNVFVDFSLPWFENYYNILSMSFDYNNDVNLIFNTNAVFNIEAIGINYSRGNVIFHREENVAMMLIYIKHLYLFENQGDIIFEEDIFGSAPSGTILLENLLVEGNNYVYFEENSISGTLLRQFYLKFNNNVVICSNAFYLTTIYQFKISNNNEIIFDSFSFENANISTMSVEGGSEIIFDSYSFENAYIGNLNLSDISELQFYSGCFQDAEIYNINITSVSDVVFSARTFMYSNIRYITMTQCDSIYIGNRTFSNSGTIFVNIINCDDVYIHSSSAEKTEVIYNIT